MISTNENKQQSSLTPFVFLGLLYLVVGVLFNSLVHASGVVESLEVARTRMSFERRSESNFMRPHHIRTNTMSLNTLTTVSEIVCHAHYALYELQFYDIGFLLCFMIIKNVIK